MARNVVTHFHAVCRTEWRRLPDSYHWAIARPQTCTGACVERSVLGVPSGLRMHRSCTAGFRLALKCLLSLTYKWWRRRELNPRPKMLSVKSLHT